MKTKWRDRCDRGHPWALELSHKRSDRCVTLCRLERRPWVSKLHTLKQSVYVVIKPCKKFVQTFRYALELSIWTADSVKRMTTCRTSTICAPIETTARCW